jgi:peptide chain release factor 2
MSAMEEVEILLELAGESTAEGERASVLGEAGQALDRMEHDADALEVKSLLSAPFDGNGAYLSLNAGAGGTESCDWADMLFRMYKRYCERSGLEVSVMNLQPGDEAGIKSVDFQVTGPFAYGVLKAERGVHRLVRISPFDANARRHTSFAALDVIAEVDDDIDVEIRDEDLRVDTYRSSGAGGQHVNTTDSAVRITHLPTGLVVTCQAERSQHKNRSKAMKMLKAKLYEWELDQKRKEMEKFYGQKGEIAWGSQIRSYVLQPYTLAKDHRTRHETGNVHAVLDGNLDGFIQAYLKMSRHDEHA